MITPFVWGNMLRCVAAFAFVVVAPGWAFAAGLADELLHKTATCGIMQFEFEQDGSVKITNVSDDDNEYEVPARNLVWDDAKVSIKPSTTPYVFVIEKAAGKFSFEGNACTLR